MTTENQNVTANPSAVPGTAGIDLLRDGLDLPEVTAVVEPTKAADAGDISAAEDEVQTPAAAEAANEAADVVLADLLLQVGGLLDTVTVISQLQENGFFKYASKAQRNTLLTNLLEGGKVVEETSRVAFRALKKVKRQHVPDEIVDALLISRTSPTWL